MRLALALATLMAATPAWAVDRCMARVLRDVGADEEPASVMHKGGHLFGPITQVKIGRKTGRASYCAHGDYCYGSGAMDMAAPCRFDQSDFSDDENIYLTAR
ncbi:MAG: hypothetical protein ACRYGP_28330 [Janthinobacterium lividum]